MVLLIKKKKNRTGRLCQEPDEWVDVFVIALGERDGFPDTHEWKWCSVCLVLFISSLIFAVFLFVLGHKIPKSNQYYICACVRDIEIQRGCNWCWRIVLCLLKAYSWLDGDWLCMAHAAGWQLLWMWPALNFVHLKLRSAHSHTGVQMMWIKIYIEGGLDYNHPTYTAQLEASLCTCVHTMRVQVITTVGWTWWISW